MPPPTPGCEEQIQQCMWEDIGSRTYGVYLLCARLLIQVSQA